MVLEHNGQRILVISKPDGTFFKVIAQENLFEETYGLENIVSTWRGLKTISVREALANISPTGGQGFTRCGCKGACDTMSCKCKKANVICNSRCHAGSTKCKNC